MNWSNRLYQSLPVFLQNSVISLYGIRKKQQKFGGHFRDYLQDIQSHLHFGVEEFRHYQNERIRELVAEAGTFVPYYQRLFKEIGLDPHNFDPETDFPRIPLLDKSTILSAPGDFQSRKESAEPVISLNTTGSTGSPLNFSASLESRRRIYAFGQRWYHTLGLDILGRTAVIGGRIIQAADDLTPPFCRHDAWNRTMYFSSYHISARTARHYVDELNRFRPETIDAYPSSVYMLAHFALEQGLVISPPKAIITSSETLLDSHREIIEKAFGCSVYDQYGSTEMVAFVAQCRQGTYHVHPDFSLVEVLADGQPVAAGETGEIVCTGWNNPLMPLIRYRLKDMAVMGGGECSCGLHTPTLRRIVGRLEDLVMAADGRWFGRLDHILKGLPVKEAQYIQEKKGELHLRLVPNAGYGLEHEAMIRTRIAERLGPEMVLHLESCEYIERGPGGKLRAVISRLPKKDRIGMEDIEILSSGEEQ